MRALKFSELTPNQVTFLEALAAMPSEHDEHGCPMNRFFDAALDKYREEKTDLDADDKKFMQMIWSMSYDDGRSCPARDCKFTAEYILNNKDE